jgi:soluble lytic murein transglycosylase-like protein
MRNLEMQTAMNRAEHSSDRLPAGVTDRKKWEAAQQFQAMFTNELVKSMRSTIPQGEMTEASNGRQIFTSMLDQQYADQMSRQMAPTGLAMQIYKQMERDDGTAATKALTNPQSPAFNPFVDFGNQAPAASGTDQGRASKAYRTLRSDSLANPSSVGARALPENIDKEVRAASRKHGVPVDLVRAVIMQESGGNPKAVSPAGARGLMQLMPKTAEYLGVKNSFDVRQNIEGGVKYLRQMLDRHDGDTKLALASYNAGPGTVKRFGGIPPYAETRQYVASVLKRQAQFNQIQEA